MVRLMRNLKIRTKIVLIVTLLLIVNVMLAGVFIRDKVVENQKDLKALETDIRTTYDNNLKYQVQQVVSLLATIEAKRVAGEYTLEEAQKLAADLVREMRYGDNNYFWIDTYEGNNVVLLGNETEGTNRLELQDKKGTYMVKEFIKLAQQPDGGFLDYWFPKPNETEPSPKRGYTLTFEPYQWVIGTGNYTDYIDKVVSDEKNTAQRELMSSVINFCIIFLVGLVLAITISIIIARILSRDFSLFSKLFNTLAKGDLTARLPDSYSQRKDDFGALAADVEKMKEAVSQLIGSVKSEAGTINDVVITVNGDVRELNGNIEDVAATTQELAASMQETAASAQEMSATSQEIESASHSIATKSQEAALQVVEISKRAKNTRKNVRGSQSRASEIGKEIERKLQDALEQIKVVEQINNLTQSIMGITEQTNLLALNASIEAARAGEHGKGFAVVASEIRRLADQSKNEVENIQGMVEIVNSAVGNLSGSSEELLKYVTTDVLSSFQGFLEVADAYQNDAVYVDELITEFSATSEELSASIENIISAVNEIAKAASEGATGTADIAQKIANITDRSVKVATQIEHSKNSSEKLNKEISYFTV